MMRGKHAVDAIFLVITAVAMLAALYMALLYAPTEQTMGDVQRIFYFHVPSAWVAFFAFFLVFLFSFIYLMRGGRQWDIRASAAAEIGVLFCSLVLITGPIWAKPVWGIWWTWDARLTLTLVLWLIYVAYLMLRHYVIDPERRATFSAVVGIMGFIDVPIVYFSIRWWRTQHPQPVLAGGEDSGLDPAMWQALLVCVVAFMLLFFFLLRKRTELQYLRDDLDALHERFDQTVP
ncbi:MAG: cytochrome c biogenesis protein [Candidatus Krumholzibacteria bacterium]|nr:cytochrome c biogenesis protein [Candidatus Krumholzibacteria bacterium]